MTKPAKSPVIKATVTTKQTQSRAARQAERDLVHRHQAALRIIDRLDVQRIAHPHVPQLANDVLRRDDVIDQAGSSIPSFGPRTASHPQATRIEPEPPRPMATRLRPALIDPQDSASEQPDRFAEIMGLAATAALITSAVTIAVWLGSR
jgi:hypothetical protein